jgi:hypothetical protein
MGPTNTVHRIANLGSERLLKTADRELVFYQNPNRFIAGSIVDLLHRDSSASWSIGVSRVAFLRSAGNFDAIATEPHVKKIGSNRGFQQIDDHVS